MAKAIHIFFILTLVTLVVFRPQLRTDSKYYGKTIQIRTQIPYPVQITGKTAHLKIQGFEVTTSPSQANALLQPGNIVTITGTVYRKVINPLYIQKVLLYPQLHLVQSWESLGWLQRLGSIKIWIIRSLYHFRLFSIKKYHKLFQSNHSTLLGGMVLGAHEPMGDNLYRIMQRSGLLHIVVASGGNIILVSSIVFFAIQSSLSRKYASYVSMVVVVLYGGLAGMDPPIVRAVLMLILVWTAQLLGRRTSTLWILLVTGLIMLGYDPPLLFSLSFQLSFAATAGIVLWGSGVHQFLLAWATKYRSTQWIAWIASDFSQTFSAQVLVMPFILHYFGQMHLGSLLANVLIGPVVAPVMISGVILLIVDLLFHPLAQWLAWLVSFLLDYILKVAELVANTSIGMVEFTFDWLAVALWIVVVVGIKIQLAKKIMRQYESA